MRGVFGCVLCPKRLRLCKDVDECKPLGGGSGTHGGDARRAAAGVGDRLGGRGLHSSTSRLNLSRFSHKYTLNTP